jgi:SAM-dependent MidA family methyltransferase
LTVADLPGRLTDRIRAQGPISFAEFMEAALYDDDGGFYARGGQAGRRGDFLTSPEVGPLFGLVLARAIDTWWDDLGRPAPFTVVDAGAGPGTLGRSVLAAQPRCLIEGALRYVAVERSAAQRARHDNLLASAGFSSSASMPCEQITGVVLANELLDNLPFRVAVFDGGWREAFVDVAPGPGPRFVEVLRPFEPVPACLAELASHGARAPVQDAAARFVREALERLRRGRIVMLDYSRSTVEMASSPWRTWLRTYRTHQRGGHYLAEPGSQDITVDVALDQLPRPSATQTQAEFLARHRMAELVDEGRAAWAAKASAPDLAAFAARSRLREAEALSDPEGLGGFTVAEWLVD